LPIYCQPRGTLPWRDRPARFDVQLFGIYRYDLALVVEVYEDRAFAVGSRELGVTTQRDQSRHFAGFGFDSRRVGATAIEGEHAVRRRIVDDAIGISANLHLSDGLQRLWIKDRNGTITPVAGEAASEIVGDGDAVHAGRVGNFPRALAGIGVKDHHSS